MFFHKYVRKKLSFTTRLFLSTPLFAIALFAQTYLLTQDIMFSLEEAFKLSIVWGFVFITGIAVGEWWKGRKKNK